MSFRSRIRGIGGRSTIPRGTTVINLLYPNKSTGTDTLGTTAGFDKVRGTETVTSSTAEFKQGSRSCKVITIGSDDSEGVNLGEESLAVGTYTFSAWVKTTNGTPIAISIQGGGMAKADVTVSGTGDWQLMQTTRTTLTTAISVKYIYTPSAEAITFYIDQVQFETGPVANSWVLGSGS